MINEEKVALMTRMAAYEGGEGKKDAAICSYFRSDYVGFQLLKTWIGATVAFGILAGINLLYRLDDLMESLYGLDIDGLFEMGRKLFIMYAFFCGVYLLITYVTAHIVYARAHKAMGCFHRELTALVGRPEEEEE